MYSTSQAVANMTLRIVKSGHIGSTVLDCSGGDYFDQSRVPERQSLATPIGEKMDPMSIAETSCRRLFQSSDRCWQGCT
ncbi:hypothetical protein ACVSQB_33890 [Bradyrhizobium elkanii]